MTRQIRTFVVLVVAALASTLLLVGPAFAQDPRPDDPPAEKKKPRVKVKVKGETQSKLLRRGIKLRVKVRSKRARGKRARGKRRRGRRARGERGRGREAREKRKNLTAREGRADAAVYRKSRAKQRRRANRRRRAERRRRAGKVRVRLVARSRTFDDQRARKLVRIRKVRVRKGKTRTVRMRLNRAGRKAVATCQARSIVVRVKGETTQFELIRDSEPCKPKPVDLSRAARCDFIAAREGSACLLPFPDDYYTVDDPSSATGKRIALQTAAMPANSDGVHMDAAPYRVNDGFSPGQAIVTKIPGLDTPQALAQTNPVGLPALSRYAAEHAPVVVIDAETGKRHPIWVEIDSNAPDPARAALLIHPARNFASGHRYIVAMRNLRDAAGNVLATPEGFRYYRDGLPSEQAVINAQRDRFDSIFTTLRDAGIQRSNLYLAWDFTVASDENIARYTLSMRDQAFALLGDTNLADRQVPAGSTAPTFNVTSVQNFTPVQDAEMARRVQGTFEVPCYMTEGAGGVPCAPGAVLNLNGQGAPTPNGTWTANFNCMIPRSSLSAPARPTVYGHGLLGSAGEATSGPQKSLGNAHNIMDCATDEIGMSSSDIGNTIGILGQMGDFPELADRLQQGLINGLYLGRLLIHPDGFVSDAAFRVNDAGPVNPANPPVIDTSNLYYNGNSQGAIFGGALTALAPDFTRASLGVGGMNYSVLLNRSVDFDLYKAFLDPAYPDPLTQQLILSLVQMLWDRGESNGYAHRATDNPLPNTPPHEILMNIGFGDHQVSNFTTETMARTIGASIHSPVVYAGRWPQIDQIGWGIPRIGNYPFRDSALVYWDGGPVRDDPGSPDPTDLLGTNPPPVRNISNRSGIDPHEMPRRTAAEQQMVADFLRPNAASRIDDTCIGPCYDYTFSGP